MFAVLQPWRQWRSAPPDLKQIFWHLYLDIAWFGLFAGSTMAFAAVYAARLGASAVQIGLLSAGPAVVNLLFTLPAGSWLRRRPVGKAVFRSALLARVPYLPWIFLPFVADTQTQVWTLVVLVLVSSIPGTVLAIGFNALYASAVPPEWRGQVVGIRNALLSIIYIGTSLLCGWILNRLPLAQGYQIIFALGFLGVVMSTVHLWFLRKLQDESAGEPNRLRTSLGDYANPGVVRFLGLTLRSSIGLRVFSRGTDLLRPDVLRGNYLRLMIALFLFHFGQFFAIPLFPLRWVEDLRFTDGVISLGTAVFYVAVLLGSLPFDQLTKSWGNRKLVYSGALLLSVYPLLTAWMTNAAFYLLASLLGGFAWALVGGALANYLLEKIPAGDRPAHLAWYNLALNGAILLGSLAGPAVATRVGIVDALLIGFGLRLLATLALWLVDKHVGNRHLSALSEP